jgi:1-aminocyclopropane-1-carboxylate deaminase/D-cysteine desulfhydrase-like pyridoxal-dependent ACC family enzyme
MAAKKAKALTLAHVQGMEARVMALIADIEQTATGDDLEEAGRYVPFFVEMMIEEGYHPVAADGFLARGRKAVADGQVRLGLNVPATKKAGANAAGLNVAYFAARLKGVVAILSNYTPAELARECARMARIADPRVLQEDEFQ